MREVVEAAISGSGRAVPAAERAYVQALRAAPTATQKIDTYAAALAEMCPRTGPVFEALRIAAASEPTCAALHHEIIERRASNMRLLAAELRTTGSVRGDLSDADLADIVWAMNSADYYLLLVQRRGWTPQHLGEHLAETWTRLFLVAC
jgi:hypothetical protein